MTAEPFHPDLRGLARWLPRSAVGPRTIGPVRAVGRLAALRSADGVAVETIGLVSARVHRPTIEEDRQPAMLWVHGGGYVIGSPAQDDALCRHFAEQLGMTVVALDYRLAPEHPYPVPLHDCYDALAWLARQPYVDPSRIVVGGGSAGGGLAAALALLARDRGEIEPALQLLSYPMLDDRTAIRTDIDERSFRLWNNKSNRFGWTAYTGLPPGSPDISELAAPARCEDLAGLAPAWIGVGALDLFCDEDRLYAKRLEEAGVPCELNLVGGAFHGFDSVLPKAGVSRAFRAAQVEALRGALG